MKRLDLFYQILVNTRKDKSYYIDVMQSLFDLWLITGKID